MLEFIVNEQLLQRADKNSPATDSIDYLKAKFTFKSSDWDGAEKKAIFKSHNGTYDAVLDSTGVCIVPWEVLEQEESILNAERTLITVTLVGTKGGQRITTNDLTVALNNSGYEEGENSKDPTPSAYEQFVSRVEVTAAATKQNAADVAEAEERIKNDYANTLKGNVSGEVVRVDDVSPIEHTAKVNVHGKNLFNGVLLDGLLMNADFSVSNGSYTVGVFKSLKAYLTAGIYTLSFGIPVNLNRKLIDGVCEYISETNVTQFTFTVKKAGYVGVTFRNAISNTTLWDEATIIQLEKGDTATEYEPYIDPSAVKLSRCGKNLISYPYVHGEKKTTNGITFTVNADRSITATGTATADAFFNLSQRNLDNIEFVKTECSYDSGNKYAYISVAGGTTVNKVFRPQIEAGSVATEWEQPSSFNDYTPDANGNVDVTSVSPTMTLFTDTDGVIIELEYNKDTNKAVMAVYDYVNEVIGGIENGSY